MLTSLPLQRQEGALLLVFSFIHLEFHSCLSTKLLLTTFSSPHLLMHPPT